MIHLLMSIAWLTSLVVVGSSLGTAALRCALRLGALAGRPRRPAPLVIADLRPLLS
jgi:hypothetical protein